MVKIKKSKKGDKYIVPEIPKSGFHISIHNSGHVHVIDEKKNLHADIDGLRKFYFYSPNLEKLLQTGDLICRPCEKYPDCICLDLALNLKLLENKEYGKTCIELQKFQGGPCPIFHGVLCLWSKFCRANIDPSPYARKF